MENASERLGVAPERVMDYLALVGDSSDNVPGVKGIGDKTARELVNEFGDLEYILRAAPDVTKKRPREALLAHADTRPALEASSSPSATTCPSRSIPNNCARGLPDTSALRPIFVELEFTNLAARTSTAMRHARPRGVLRSRIASSTSPAHVESVRRHGTAGGRPRPSHGHRA